MANFADTHKMKEILIYGIDYSPYAYRCNSKPEPVLKVLIPDVLAEGLDKKESYIDDSPYFEGKPGQWRVQTLLTIVGADGKTYYISDNRCWRSRPQAEIGDKPNEDPDFDLKCRVCGETAGAEEFNYSSRDSVCYGCTEEDGHPQVEMTDEEYNKHEMKVAMVMTTVEKALAATDSDELCSVMAHSSLKRPSDDQSSSSPKRTKT